MYKLTTECAFQFNQNFKQTEGCSIGGPSSVILADIHMIRTAKDIATPLKPIFYKNLYMISIPEERKVFMISYMKDLTIIIQTLS